MVDTPPHPTTSFWLDTVDQSGKLVAVFIGTLWNNWNFRKSRIFEEKIELEISGFTLPTRMEPNETIDDTLYWRVPSPSTTRLGQTSTSRCT